MGINIIEQNNGEQLFEYKIQKFVSEGNEGIGDKEEDFEILQVIGAGAFSQVLKVKSKKNFQIYAMKKVDMENTEDRQNLENEAKFLPKLNHPNIVKCHNVFWDHNNKYLYFIMELMNNGDLESFKEGFIDFKKHPPENILWKIFYDCLKGLQYIHREEIMHRDIKPKNLFFDENLKVKIGDFNTSVTLTESAAQKFSGSKVENEFRSMMSNNISVGTEGYQAPEMNSYNYDEKVDVYSMGSTFFELCYLTNHHTVDKSDYFEKNIYSKELNDLIKNMIEDDPEERCSSFEAYAIAKKNYILKFLKNTAVVSVLRCLYEFPNFKNYFMNKNENDFEKGREVAKSVFNIFKSLSENNVDGINESMYDLRGIIEKYGMKVQRKDIEIDPIVLLFNLLSRLNSELNDVFGERKERTVLEYKKSSKNYRFETGQEENFFKERLGIYNRNISSLISQNFFNFIKTDIICKKCNDVGHYFSQMLYIPFNVEILAKKRGNDNLNIKTAFECLIQDEIQINLKKGKKCTKCNENNELIQTKKLYHTAKNLIIILDRGKDCSIDIQVDFEETLQLKDGLIERFNEINYYLVGILEKIDDQYVSFAKKNDLWVSSEGKELTFDDVKKCGKVIALFYYSEDNKLILKSEQIQMINGQILPNNMSNMNAMNNMMSNMNNMANNMNNMNNMNMNNMMNNMNNMNMMNNMNNMNMNNMMNNMNNMNMNNMMNNMNNMNMMNNMNNMNMNNMMNNMNMNNMMNNMNNMNMNNMMNNMNMNNMMNNLSLMNNNNGFNINNGIRNNKQTNFMLNTNPNITLRPHLDNCNTNNMNNINMNNNLNNINRQPTFIPINTGMVNMPINQNPNINNGMRMNFINNNPNIIPCPPGFFFNG